MRSKPVRLLALAGAGLALVLAGLFLIPWGAALVITPAQGGPPWLTLPLGKSGRFTLHYYHSVEEAPIWEEHSVDEDGRIFIEEERYLKFGAGMGRMPGVGRMVMRGPYEAITDMHMPTGDFVLRVGNPGVDHTVIWSGGRVNLSRSAAGRAMRFSARPISLGQFCWLKLFSMRK